MAEQKNTGATVIQTRIALVSFDSPPAMGARCHGSRILICIKNPLKLNGLSWMINRPIYPMISRMHPLIMLAMKPHDFVRTPCHVCAIIDRAKTTMKTIVEGVLG